MKQWQIWWRLQKISQGVVTGCSLHSSSSRLTCEASSSRSSVHPSWWRSSSWCTLPSDWTASRRSRACCWPERRWPPGSAEGESCWRDSRCGHRWTGRPVCAGPRRTARAPGLSRSCQTPACTAPEDEKTTEFNITSVLFIYFVHTCYNVQYIVVSCRILYSASVFPLVPKSLHVLQPELHISFIAAPLKFYYFYSVYTPFTQSRLYQITALCKIKWSSNQHIGQELRLEADRETKRHRAGQQGTPAPD